MLKTYAQAYSDIKAQIIARNKNINVNQTSVMNDLFIVPQSNETVRELVISDFTQQLQSYDLILQMLVNTDYISLVASAYGISDSDVANMIYAYLDELASNYGLVRKPAVNATGIVYFYRNLIPTSDITILNGTKIAATNGQQYEVLADITMLVSQASTYVDPDVDGYSIAANVKAINSGIQGNASANTIIQFVDSVSGMDGVTNKTDIGNGTDIEAYTALIERMKLIYSGNNAGTKDGYKKLILSNVNTVTDVYVAGASDPFMIRDGGNGGKVDVYILGTVVATAMETVSATMSSKYYTLKKQPAISLTGVNETSGTPVLPENNVDINYDGSVMAKARLNWTNFVNQPPVTPYGVTYTYDENIGIVQNLINTDVNKIVFGTPDAVLVKQAIEVPVDIIFSFNIFSGYDRPTIKTQLQTLITNNLSLLKLGDALQQSDVINWAYQIEGLDSVILPMTKFNRTSSTGAVDTITVLGKEYIRANSIL